MKAILANQVVEWESVYELESKHDQLDLVLTTGSNKE